MGLFGTYGCSFDFIMIIIIWRLASPYSEILKLSAFYLAEKQMHLFFIDSVPPYAPHCIFTSFHILGSVHNKDTRKEKNKLLDSEKSQEQPVHFLM